MTEFKIRRGLSSQLFPYPEYPNKLHEDLVIEPGCWYLCTDTADLFLGIQHDDRLSLKRVNGDVAPILPEGSLVSISRAEINEAGELVLYYTDGSSANLGKVVGKDGDPGVPGDPGKEGLTTAVKIGDLVYTQKDGMIELPNFVNKDYVDNKFDSIEIPEIPKNLSEFKNDAGYITQADIPNIDLTDYALKEELPVVPDKISAFENDKGYLTKHQDLSDYAKKSEIPSIAGLATEEFVTQKIADAELADKDVDLSAYYTKTEVDSLIPDTTKFLTEVPEEYVTANELAAKGYLTEHQDLSAYAKQSDLPDITGLATQSFVQEQVKNIEIPEPDLTDYYSKTETTNAINTAVSGKANVVLFGSDSLVTNPIGSFAAGENIKGLTINQILAKLLGLNETPGENPEEPEIPEIPEGVIGQIIANELSMYSVTETGELISVPFKCITMTEAEAAQPCTESEFYQIKDDSGTIIESGYQEIQANSSDIYYVIALPKELNYDSMITIKTYDIRQKLWVEAEKFKMVSDPEKVAELCEEVNIDISGIDQTTYTILVWEDLPSGSLLRYIINE
jgi:hypothetical protein